MRIEIPRYSERLGALRIHDVQRVIEIDSGGLKSLGEDFHVIRFSSEEIKEIESRMAIVLPVKNEKPNILEGVLSGIPHDVLVIVVSNSSRTPIDRYQIEVDTMLHFYRFSRRSFIMIHQKDHAWGLALKEVGYTEILEGDTVRDGKGEGMVLGMILAKALGKDYVGFVDSDNYIPGAVYEYAKIYASAFLSSRTPYAMVRIRWPYKTKFVGKGFYFRRRGRVSEITNKYINLLLGRLTRFETDIVKTGNSGDHAMTIKLAEVMQFMGGFGIEPYELIYLIEEFSGLKPTKYEDVISKGVEVFQVEPRNPHVHEERGTEHIKEMILKSLSIIYHSSLCNEELKELILDELVTRGILRPGEIPPRQKAIPPIGSINANKVLEILAEHGESFIATET